MSTITAVTGFSVTTQGRTYFVGTDKVHTRNNAYGLVIVILAILCAQVNVSMAAANCQAKNLSLLQIATAIEWENIDDIYLGQTNNISISLGMLNK